MRRPHKADRHHARRGYRVDGTGVSRHRRSLGQPRDRDVRASYVVVTVNGRAPNDGYGAEVEFVRVEYDIEKAVNKILAVPDLDDFLGTRLLDGR